MSTIGSHWRKQPPRCMVVPLGPVKDLTIIGKPPHFSKSFDCALLASSDSPWIDRVIPLRNQDTSSKGWIRPRGPSNWPIRNCANRHTTRTPQFGMGIMSTWRITMHTWQRWQKSANQRATWRHQNAKWKSSMEGEIGALTVNKTWDLIDRPWHYKPIGCKCL